ncbi:MAG: lipase family protein [Candidatus Omnitrophica bacterium]|nr:lipase family protein [Candidatus Omnitrophota bacterium]
MILPIIGIGGPSAKAGPQPATATALGPLLELNCAGFLSNRVELNWADLGQNYTYTIECLDRLGGSTWFPCPPGEQWPLITNRWVGVTELSSASRFYRVRAELVQPERGKLEASTLMGSLSVSNISALAKLYGIPLTPQSGVVIYKLDYETVDPFNALTQASGALVIPENRERALPLVSYQHGTIVLRDEAPSAYTGEILVGVAFATTGYAAVLPDYLGLGDSPGFHPYHHARSEATAVVDMLRAARAFCLSNSIALNDQLFLCGYSQGGHATMAAHKAIEANYADEFAITASAPMAGAYDLSGVTAADFLSDRVMPNPYYFIYLLAAYQNVYHFAASLEDLLAAPYNTTLPPLMDGLHDESEIDLAMPNIPKQVLKPEYLKDFRTNPNHPLRMALRDNDLYHWGPRAPMHLYHVHGDQDVLYANSEVAYESFTNHGAAQVQLIDPFPSGNHTTGFFYCLLDAKAWFDSLVH